MIHRRPEGVAQILEHVGLPPKAGARPSSAAGPKRRARRRGEAIEYFAARSCCYYGLSPRLSEQTDAQSHHAHCQEYGPEVDEI